MLPRRRLRPAAHLQPPRLGGSLPAHRRGRQRAQGALVLIDGEAVACDRDGLPSFDRLRYRRADGAVFLFAFAAGA
jgi:hypothetical protein